MALTCRALGAYRQSGNALHLCACEKRGVGKIVQQEVEAVLSPEQFAGDNESRYAENTLFYGGLRVVAQALLHLGRVDTLAQIILRERIDQGIPRCGVLGNVPVLPDVRENSADSRWITVQRQRQAQRRKRIEGMGGGCAECDLFALRQPVAVAEGEQALAFQFGGSFGPPVIQ